MLLLVGLGWWTAALAALVAALLLRSMPRRSRNAPGPPGLPILGEVKNIQHEEDRGRRRRRKRGRRRKTKLWSCLAIGCAAGATPHGGAQRVRKWLLVRHSLVHARKESRRKEEGNEAKGVAARLG